MGFIVTPRFCIACGGALISSLPSDSGGSPLVCSRCGLPTYQDPKVAVAVAVRDRDGQVLLMRRAQRDQAHGLWILPGGHVDRGEELTSAALREVREETGLRVDLGRLLGVYSYPGNPVVLVAYAALSLGGDYRASREALEMNFFPPAQIPWDSLGYASTGDALRAMLERSVP